MEAVYVMTLEAKYDKPREDGFTGWAMVDTVFESLEDCQEYIDKEFDENTGFDEVSEGHYVYHFKLDCPLVLNHEDGKEVLVEEGRKLTIMVDKIEFIRKKAP